MKSEKQNGGILKPTMAAIAILCIGGGGTYAAFATGLVAAGASDEDDTPRLVRKGDVDPYAPAPAKGAKDAPSITYGDGGSEYRVAYFTFEESFISNLSGSDALIQLDLAASTRRDGRVLQWLLAHELAVRSAILAQLAATPERDVLSVDGKDRLADRLARAINSVLEEKEGFGGVDAVHFKTFLVQ
jgi:flagellar FliL protein